MRLLVQTLLIPKANCFSLLILPLLATSIVEVQLLQYVGSEEKVSVMCSIDVLKMRSEYFYDLLCEQDRLGFTERACGGITNTTGAQSSRPPIIITEASPFEAAAFFESLHEGIRVYQIRYCALPLFL